MRTFYSILLLTIILAGSCQNEKQRVLYINSYHAGYPPSDEIGRGMINLLPADSFILQTVFLDSKRQPYKDHIHSRIDSILKIIDEFKPHFLVVSDDAAVKYLIEPYASDLKVPVLFCGVNWSAAQYQLPKSNITGMLEILPLRAAIGTILKHYPESKTIAIISENSLSEQNNTKLLDTLYQSMGLTPQYYLEDDFERWKEAFVMANRSCDFIYLPTNGAIRGWNNQEAIDFVCRNSLIPTFTCDDFMMHYVAFGLTKVPAEQGIWVATTIKKILQGTSIDQIPITQNTQSKAWINVPLSRIIDFKCDSSLWKSAEKIMN